MLRTQLIAIVIALVTIVFLYNLPKVIINDTDKNKLADKSQPHQNVSGAINSAQELTISPLQVSEIEKLRKNFYGASDIKKRVIFADSLANLFVAVQKFDSASKYAGELVLLKADNRTRIAAGNIYYQIFSSLEDPTVANSFAAKAQEQYKEVLKSDPENAEVKNNLAMTYVTSENPMQAIALLREVLAKNPSDETALFNLGLLSIRSGQYDKAVERFKRLTEINERNWKAHFYLGIALDESGKKNEAVEKFDLVAKNTKDPDLKAEAERLIGRKN